jgi:hypothetical protein
LLVRRTSVTSTDDNNNTATRDGDHKEERAGLGRWFHHLPAQRYVFVRLDWPQLTSCVRLEH